MIAPMIMMSLMGPISNSNTFNTLHDVGGHPLNESWLGIYSIRLESCWKCQKKKKNLKRVGINSSSHAYPIRQLDSLGYGRFSSLELYLLYMHGHNLGACGRHGWSVLTGGVSFSGRKKVRGQPRRGYVSSVSFDHRHSLLFIAVPSGFP